MARNNGASGLVHEACITRGHLKRACTCMCYIIYDPDRGLHGCLFLLSDPLCCNINPTATTIHGIKSLNKNSFSIISWMYFDHNLSSCPGTTMIFNLDHWGGSHPCDFHGKGWEHEEGVWKVLQRTEKGIVVKAFRTKMHIVCKLIWNKVTITCLFLTGGEADPGERLRIYVEWTLGLNPDLLLYPGTSLRAGVHVRLPLLNKVLQSYIVEFNMKLTLPFPNAKVMG